MLLLGAYFLPFKYKVTNEAYFITHLQVLYVVILILQWPLKYYYLPTRGLCVIMQIMQEKFFALEKSYL